MKPEKGAIYVKSYTLSKVVRSWVLINSTMVYAVYDSLWQSLTILWQSLTVYDCLWQSKPVYDSILSERLSKVGINQYYNSICCLWQSLTVYDSPWQSMTVYDSLWQCMTVYDSLWQSKPVYEMSMIVYKRWYIFSNFRNADVF